MTGGRERDLSRLADLAREQPALPRVARERAIQAALAAAATTEAAESAPMMTSAPERRRSTLRALAFGGVAMAAAAAIVVMMLSRKGGGELDAAHDERPGTELQLGRASITVSGQQPARLAERRSRDGIMLSQGAVKVDLPADAAHPYRIETQRFAVVATGAQLEVTQDGIRVTRGSVRVESLQSVILAPSVEAGQSWSVEGGVVDIVSDDQSAKAAPAGDEVDSESDTPSPTDEGAEEPAEEAPAPAAKQPSAAHELARARRALAAGKVDRARAAIARALEAHPHRSQRAEAETLRADCAMVAGDVGEALSGYEAVATVYHDTPAGENALFAAARLAARSGKRDLARTLLDHYSKTYPGGRFAHEVDTWRRRLGQ